MYRFKQLLILVGDCFFWYGFWFLALLLRGRTGSIVGEYEALLPHLTAIFTGTVIGMFVGGFYDLATFRNTLLLIKKTGFSIITTFLGGSLYFYLVNPATTAPKTILGLAVILSFAAFFAWRLFNRRFVFPVLWQTRILFVGATDETSTLITTLFNHPERGYRPVGIVGTDLAETLPPLKRYISVDEALKQENADTIVVSPQKTEDRTITQQLYRHIFDHLTVVPFYTFYESITGRISPATFSDIWFLTNLREQEKKIYDRFRMLIDYPLAIVLGGIFVATLPFIALAVKLSSPGPIFFRQVRVGRNGKHFTLVKYRSMKVLAKDGSAEAQGAQFTANNDPRITMIGKFLRRTRLDEVPQFINILAGDMGFIGPRPERPEFVDQISDQVHFYHLRHLVKPGLTGWAQVRESYYGTINENLRKLEYDLYYVKHRGPILDFNILLRTLSIVVGMKGR